MLAPKRVAWIIILIIFINKVLSVREIVINLREMSSGVLTIKVNIQDGQTTINHNELIQIIKNAKNDDTIMDIYLMNNEGKIYPKDKPISIYLLQYGDNADFLQVVSKSSEPVQVSCRLCYRHVMKSLHAYIPSNVCNHQLILYEHETLQEWKEKIYQIVEKYRIKPSNSQLVFIKFKSELGGSYLPRWTVLHHICEDGERIMDNGFNPRFWSMSALFLPIEFTKEEADEAALQNMKELEDDLNRY